MKKIFISLLIITLLSSFFVVSAENVQPSFQLSSESVECGKEVTVSVSLNDNASVASFTLDIEYDKTMVQPMGVSKTDLLPGQMIPNLQYRDNALRVVYASDRNINTTGEILKIKFKAIDYQKGGTDCDLIGIISFLGNQELETINGTVKNSKISIAENPNYIENEEKELSISSVKCNAKEEVTITISTPDILDVCSGSLTICYDAGLQILQCEKGDILSELNVMINPENEKNQIRMNFMGITPVSKAGDIVKIKLSAKSNETKNYNVFLKDVELFKLDESFVPVKSNIGVVEATEVKIITPGGSSGNGGSIKPTQPTEKPDESKEEASTNKEETVTTSWSNPFVDIKETDWFYENVKYVVENKLMNGIAEDEFAPNNTLTRAMLVTVLYRNAGEPAVNKSVPFADVDMSAWYANAVIWAKQNGIVNGVNETDFAPDNNITREQIAAIMHRYAQYKGYDVSVGENTNILSYDDAESVSEYAIASMQYVVGSGLIKGKSATTLNPLDNATRAEIAAILQRFIEGNK